MNYFTKYKKWLNQFEESDKSTAELLVKQLTYVPKKNFDYTIRTLFDETVNKNETTAFYVVRESPYNKKNKSYTKPFWSKPDENPIKIDNQQGTGSEGSLWNLLRDLINNNPYFLDNPSIQKMREKKCKHIVLLNDFAGSGNQTKLFVHWLYDNKTIKSWISLKYIDITVLHYATTDIADKLFSNDKIIAKHFCAKPIKIATPELSDKQIEKIRNLCEKYGTKIQMNRDWFYGYDECFLFLFFETSAPNNLPGIIWYSNTNWFPLIPRKRPDFIQDINFFSKTIKNIINRSTLFIKNNKSINYHEYSTSHKLQMLILQKLQLTKYNEKKFAYFFDQDIFAIRKCMTSLQNNGFIDESLKITKNGKKILHYFIKKINPITKIENNDEIYYPKSLRAPVE